MPASSSRRLAVRALVGTLLTAAIAAQNPRVTHRHADKARSSHSFDDKQSKQEMENWRL
jgi:hypothetical protein